MKLNLVLILSLAAALLTLGAYLYYSGGEGERTHQVKAQAKHDKAVRKKYDAIDKDTPYLTDKRTAIDWLYTHGGR